MKTNRLWMLHMMMGMLFVITLVAGVLALSRPASACQAGGYGYGYGNGYGYGCGDDEWDDEWDNGYGPALFLTVQDTDPLSYTGDGIDNSHQVNQSFPVYVFLAKSYGCNGTLPRSLKDDVNVTLSVWNENDILNWNGWREPEPSHQYTLTIPKGQEYGTVNISVATSGWHYYQVTASGSSENHQIFGNDGLFHIKADNNSPVLSINPAMVNLSPGGTQQLSASFTVNGQTQDVTYDCNWSSSDDSIAAVVDWDFWDYIANFFGWNSDLPPGYVKAGNTSGTATITCSIIYQHTTYTATAVVNVASATLQIAPENQQIPIGATVQFIAQVGYPNGTMKDVTQSAQWSSSKPDVASVQNASDTSPGLLTANQPGTATITATVNGVSKSTTITVMTPTMQLMSPDTTLKIGDRPQLTALLVYSDNNKTTQDVTGTVAAYISSNTSVVTVNSSGLLTAVAPGTATITATAYGISGSISITVATPAMQISSDNTSLKIGDSSPLHAEFVYGAPLNTTQDVTRLATWSSSEPGTVSISDTDGNGNVTATAKAIGVSNITAALDSIYSNTVPITVLTPTFTVTPTSKTIPITGTVSLNAQYSYSDGDTNDVTGSADWSSLDSTVATVGTVSSGNPGIVTGRGPGTTSITCTYQGLPTVNVSITVATPTLTITPSNMISNVGDSVQFTAQYSDGVNSPQNVTNDVEWSCGNSSASLASILSGKLISSETGNVTVYASYTIPGTQKTLTTENTVNFVQPTLIIEPAGNPAQISVNIGETIGFKALYSDAYVRDKEVTSLVQWASSDSSVASLSTEETSLAGTFSGISKGTTDISGQYTYTDSNNQPATVSAEPLTLTVVQPSLSASTYSLRLNQGASITNAVIVTYTDASGTKDVTGQVSWQSADPSVATATAIQDPSAQTAGSTTVQAGNIADVTSLTGTYMNLNVQVTVTVVSPQLTLSPVKPIILIPGASTAIHIAATYTDANNPTGKDVTSSVTWSLPSTGVATLNAGIVTGVTPGTTTLTASYNGLQAAIQVIVANPADIKITPTYAAANAGWTVQFNLEYNGQIIVLQDADGNPLQDANGKPIVTWESSKPSVASVDNSGLVTAKPSAPSGPVTITAHYDKKDYKASLTISAMGFVWETEPPPSH